MDSHAYNEYVVPPFYDSVGKFRLPMAKTDEAIAKMKRALEFVEGIPTTIPLLQLILNDGKFTEGDFHTDIR